MGFKVDKQTLDDLNLLGKFKQQSIFSFFNHTQTRGGERVLETMFRNPLSQVEAINARAAIFAFFREKAVSFPIEADLHDSVNDYLRRVAQSNRLLSGLELVGKKIGQALSIGTAYETVYRGVTETLKYLQLVDSFVSGLLLSEVPCGLKESLVQVDHLLNQGALGMVRRKSQGQPLRLADVAHLDYIFRSKSNKPVLHLLDLMTEIDVYNTVGRLAAQHHLTFATAAKDTACLEVEGFYHLGIPHAVPNQVSLIKENNVLFLTGANMAGKSTLMKAFSIVVYLAHMGFPVPAKSVLFAPYDGIYTSINVSDNMHLGYSHFYAEVMRVKQVAQEVASGKRLLVIFDELFKGTNVKDAYDATVGVIQAFSRYRKCSFILSTHITEAGEALRQNGLHFWYAYMPTEMQDGKPQYPYVLRPGISDDRHGMVIISQEKIVEAIYGTD